MDIRPLSPDAVEAAVDVMVAALPVPPEHDRGTRRDWLRLRTGRFLETDPGGCWVAVEGDEVIGAAMALLRDGIWGLSMLAVHPGRHARGTGGRLLAAALTHGEGARAGLICSSEDPRATRLYARAGFDLRPCVSAGGIVDRAALPVGLRSRPSDDVEQASALSRGVRGGAYDPADLAMAAGYPGNGLLLIEGRGFALHRDDGSPSVLCATGDEAAADLLWSCWAAGPRGSTVHVDFISAGQDWAVRTCLDARLPLSAEGPLFTRGELGPLRRWLPSGALL
jgi:GNAT superfamily N-acetyltransferase